MMSLESTPLRLNLKKDEKLEIEWQDGLRSIYPIALLRQMCPCALCRQQREEQRTRKKTSLMVLSGTHAGPLVVVDAELVGGYALRLEWSDDHGSGIYSFQYLREISPQRPDPGGG
jgi:DUF971 family protein